MADIPKVTGTLTTRDGLSVHYNHYEADKQKAGIVLVHGLGEHCGRYGYVVERLFPKGYSFWMADHRGHGRSGGPRGHVEHFDQYIMDLQMVVELARKAVGDNGKLFLLGHSMGGLIALTFALRMPDLLTGVVASAPALGVKVEVPKWKSSMGQIMSSIWPGLTMSNELDPKFVSHDAEVVYNYIHDPLVHHKVTARWFTEFTAAIDNAQKTADNMKIPTLMQIPGEDRFVNPQASKEFFEKLTVSDKTFKFYEPLYHEIYNETEAERNQVLDDLESWLEAHQK